MAWLARVAPVVLIAGALGCSGNHGPSTGGGIDAASASSATQLNPALARQTLTAGTGSADRGSVIMRPGQTLLLRLRSQAGTGYVWAALPQDKTTTSVIHVGTRKIEQAVAEPGGAVGSAVYDTFTISAMQPGTARAQFVYARPFEKDKPPARTYTLDLTIAP